MSPKNVNYKSAMNSLKLEENFDSLFPAAVFFIFGHLIVHKFAQLVIEQRYEGNLTKWRKILLVLPLHLQVFCFWLLFVQVLEAIAQVCNATITSGETIHTIQSIMTILYLMVAFFPMAFAVLQYIEPNTRIVVEQPDPTELGAEGMLLCAPHRHIEEVERPRAYKLKRSISSFTLREFDRAPAMPRSKTVVGLDKISNIEDFSKP